MRSKLPALFILALTSVYAAPAPWFKWHTEGADLPICAQFSPGEDWKMISGPYQDAQCRKSGVPSNN